MCQSLPLCFTFVQLKHTHFITVDLHHYLTDMYFKLY
ncbi:hypothetical protein C5L29_000011 [Lactiplantibacillus pentosus]|nr:hypothetical protein C5L29_000011 [Lactiplantibacillus pentosus]